MKFLLLITLALAFAGAAVADIQAPPSSTMTPVRKLGRGLSNVLYGISELPYTMIAVNDIEGNNAAWGYGVVFGVHRSCYRFGKGMYDIITGPVPAHKGSYRPPLSSAYIYGFQNGYTEFPPEIGFESRYIYSRDYRGF